METVSAPQEDSSGAYPSSVKSDDSSPRPGSGRGSPPPNCAICLGQCKNKSFTDSCLHQFCFSCLLTWSKVKAECPLCKQNFKSIIHNVRSNHQYEEYMVEQRHTEENIDIDSISIDSISNATRRFRYRTTLTLPRRESMAIEQLLMHYPLVPGPHALYPPPHPRAPPARRRRSPASFRRTVYRHNLWARPLPDFTGRFRDCSPEFYRYNDAQMHRLVPWLNRELHYLLNENIPHISYVLTRILELLPQHHITSPEFREAMHYFGDRTEHFLHELYCFASTPYDMTGYDRNVQYTTDTRISTMVNEVISSSDSDSVDSDIVMVSHSEPAIAGSSRGPLSSTAGPSRPPPPVFPHHYIPPTVNNVIPIETISHSDTDDGDDVMVVGYIKPPQDRTPEVVDLLGSDSDVVVQDTPAAEPSAEPSVEPTERSTTPTVKLSWSRLDDQEAGGSLKVKLSLKRHTVATDSDSDTSYVRPPHPKMRKRRRQSQDGNSSSSWRQTPSPTRSRTHSSRSDSTGSARHTSISEVSSPSTHETTSISTTCTDTDASSSRSSRFHRTNKKKSRFKSKSPTKPTNPKSKKTKRREEGDKKSRSKSSKSHKKKSQATQTERKEKKDKRSKQKTQNGHHVKSSRKNKESSSRSKINDDSRTSLRWNDETSHSRRYDDPSTTRNNEEPSTSRNISTVDRDQHNDDSKTSLRWNDETSHSRRYDEPSTSRNNEEPSTSRSVSTMDRDQPSTSGLSNHKAKSKSSKSKSRKSSRDGRKLKSVVKVMKWQQNSDSNGSSNLLNIVENAILNPNSNVLSYNSDSGSIPSDDRSRRLNEVPPEVLDKVEECFNLDQSLSQTKMQTDNSDSDDDLPLNLTLKKI